MTETLWLTCIAALPGDDALTEAVLDVHQTILREQMAGDPMLNPALGIQSRALRRIEGWRVLLLLTPWMLSRLLFPDDPPDLSLPDGWTAADRAGSDYLVLGPRMQFSLLGQPQQAHLNYHSRLGHHLLQPICLDMQPYRDAEAVFEQWSSVIRIRDENMEKAKRHCPLQKEVSRRELFRCILPGEDK